MPLGALVHTQAAHTVSGVRDYSNHDLVHLFFGFDFSVWLDQKQVRLWSVVGVYCGWGPWLMSHPARPCPMGHVGDVSPGAGGKSPGGSTVLLAAAQESLL